MPRVSVPMNPSKIFQADGDDFKLVNLFHQIKNTQGAAVGLTELVFASQNRARRLFQPFVFRSLVVEPDGIQVMSVFEFTHSGERDVDRPVDIVFALLHLRA